MRSKAGTKGTDRNVSVRLNTMPGRQRNPFVRIHVFGANFARLLPLFWSQNGLSCAMSESNKLAPLRTAAMSGYTYCLLVEHITEALE